MTRDLIFSFLSVSSHTSQFPFHQQQFQQNQASTKGSPNTQKPIETNEFPLPQAAKNNNILGVDSIWGRKRVEPLTWPCATC